LAFAYQPAAWHEFYVTYAQVNTALWGFFFVAISLHPGQIGKHPRLRSQARLNLLGLFFLLIIALVCIIPHQDAHALGIELTALWLVLIGVYGTSFAPTVRGSGHTRAPRAAQVRTIGALGMSVLGLCAGVTLWYGAGGGLLWNVGAIVLGTALVLSTAWDITFAPELYESGLPAHTPPAAEDASDTSRQPRPK
jgi:hypothetical protein